MAEAVVEEDQGQNTEQENIPPEPAVVQQKQSKGWLIFGTINLLLILLLGGGGYYLIQQVEDKHVVTSNEINKDDLREIEVSKQLNAYQTQLATMQSQIANFGEDVSSKDNHFTKTLAGFSDLHNEKLNATRKDLGEEILQLKRQLGKTRGDWLIADAEYLLSVANQRLHLMSDVKTTRMALEAADQRLRESGDAATFKVRSQIAKEIAGLDSVTLPDIVGKYSDIQLLKDKVDKLAVLLPYAGKPLTESKEIHDHADGENSEHGLLGSALSLLEGYVTVKHSDQPVTEILTLQEVEFIRQQLGVKLEMIKIALVQQNDKLFKSSIKDTQHWLNTNFTKNQHSKEFANELNDLNEILIRSQLPDISQSLKMLKDITKLRIESDKAQLESGDQKIEQSSRLSAQLESVAEPSPAEVPPPVEREPEQEPAAEAPAEAPIAVE